MLFPIMFLQNKKLQRSNYARAFLVGAGGFASRASKKAPLGLFCRRDVGRRPMLFSSPLEGETSEICKRKTSVYFYTDVLLVGAGGFEPPKLKSSRFTVCPHWPLGNTPIFISCHPPDDLFILAWSLDFVNHFFIFCAFFFHVFEIQRVITLFKAHKNRPAVCRAVA